LSRYSRAFAAANAYLPQKISAVRLYMTIHFLSRLSLGQDM
jgi:hypothetical protein